MKCPNENFEKSGRALDFWRPNLYPKWLENGVLTYRQAWVGKKLTKIATQIIFFPVKAEMLYFGTVVFGSPILGPPRRYFDMKIHTLSKNYVKNRSPIFSPFSAILPVKNFKKNRPNSCSQQLFSFSFWFSATFSKKFIEGQSNPFWREEGPHVG